ncbi:MAG: hypothetical protein IRY94_11050 [Rhodospirillaceae bacterium]|nr:hypothetical protein [Rhodospirillaceae bacterium]
MKPRREQEISGYAYAPKPAPKRTMGAELMELPADRRLTALAVSLQARGSNCAVPARDAQLVHDSLDRAVWSVTCTGGRSYTVILNADGSSMIMAGGTVEADLPSDDRSGESAPGPGTNDNRSRTARPGN